MANLKKKTGDPTKSKNNGDDDDFHKKQSDDQDNPDDSKDDDDPENPKKREKKEKKEEKKEQKKNFNAVNVSNTNVSGLDLSIEELTATQDFFLDVSTPTLGANFYSGMAEKYILSDSMIFLPTSQIADIFSRSVIASISRANLIDNHDIDQFIKELILGKYNVLQMLKEQIFPDTNWNSFSDKLGKISFKPVSNTEELEDPEEILGALGANSFLGVIKNSISKTIDDMDDTNFKIGMTKAKFKTICLDDSSEEDALGLSRIIFNHFSRDIFDKNQNELARSILSLITNPELAVKSNLKDAHPKLENCTPQSVYDIFTLLRTELSHLNVNDITAYANKVTKFINDNPLVLSVYNYVRIMQKSNTPETALPFAYYIATYAEQNIVSYTGEKSKAFSFSMTTKDITQRKLALRDQIGVNALDMPELHTFMEIVNSIALEGNSYTDLRKLIINNADSGESFFKETKISEFFSRSFSTLFPLTNSEEKLKLVEELWKELYWVELMWRITHNEIAASPLNLRDLFSHKDKSELDFTITEEKLRALATIIEVAHSTSKVMQSLLESHYEYSNINTPSLPFGDGLPKFGLSHVGIKRKHNTILDAKLLQYTAGKMNLYLQGRNNTMSQKENNAMYKGLDNIKTLFLLPSRIRSSSISFNPGTIFNDVVSTSLNMQTVSSMAINDRDNKMFPLEDINSGSWVYILKSSKAIAASDHLHTSRLTGIGLTKANTSNLGKYSLSYNTNQEDFIFKRIPDNSPFAPLIQFSESFVRRLLTYEDYNSLHKLWRYLGLHVAGNPKLHQVLSGPELLALLGLQIDVKTFKSSFPYGYERFFNSDDTLKTEYFIEVEADFKDYVLIDNDQDLSAIEGEATYLLSLAGNQMIPGARSITLPKLYRVVVKTNGLI